jgi:hypothetical protein
MTYVSLNNIYNLIKDFFEEHEIENIEPEKVHQEPFEKIPVWIYWDQGFENAPEIVQMCVKSIEKNLPYDKVELIKLTKENLSDYVVLPDYVYDHFGNNLTFVSNIIRAALLTNYGGIWFDATYLLVKQLDPTIFDREFWAIQRCYYSSKDQKCLYDFSYNLCYFQPNNEVMHFMYQALCTYCKYKERLDCYFIKDGIIVYGYKHDKYDKKYVDDAVVDQRSIEGLYGPNLNKYYSPAEMIRLQQDGTYIFKLTYKGVKIYESIQGKQTMWGYLKEKYLLDFPV